MKRIISLLLAFTLLLGLAGCAAPKELDLEAELEDMKSKLATYQSEDLAQGEDMVFEFPVMLLSGNGWKTWNKFQKRMEQGKDANLILVSFTDEGDPILHYLRCRGGTYFAVIDETRDGFRGGPEYEMGAFSAFQVTKESAEEAFAGRTASDPEDYVLFVELSGRLWSDGQEIQMHDSHYERLWRNKTAEEQLKDWEAQYQGR